MSLKVTLRAERVLGSGHDSSHGSHPLPRAPLSHHHQQEHGLHMPCPSFPAASNAIHAINKNYQTVDGQQAAAVTAAIDFLKENRPEQAVLLLAHFAANMSPALVQRVTSEGIKIGVEALKKGKDLLAYDVFDVVHKFGNQESLAKEVRGEGLKQIDVFMARGNDLPARMILQIIRKFGDMGDPSITGDTHVKALLAQELKDEEAFQRELERARHHRGSGGVPYFTYP